ncbi:MAG TPA: alpha/beta fold hydrolase [Rhodothermales bacterium]|nr:alpha/beta fold hydrolase [Rhodothermales bacterium]HRR07644.1 alpha/beta fold hydrolase [Rhodothermales bacterium]
MHRYPFKISNRSGDPLFGDMTLPDGVGPFPVLVFVHGIKGFKDWGFWPFLAEWLAEEGIASIAFNLSFNGMGAENMTEFTRLDLFEQNTLSRELSDVADMLAAIRNGLVGRGQLDAHRMGLLGHSRGGGVAIITAAEQADTLKCLITWNSVADFFQRFKPNMIQDWAEKGFTEIMNDRTGQKMRMGKVLYDDAMAHKERLDLPKQAQKLTLMPWLIVHAEDDNVVPFAHAVYLYNMAAQRPKLIKAGGQHGLGGAFPQTIPLPPALENVIARTVGYAKTYL